VPGKKSREARVAIAVPLATPWIYWRTVAAILEMERPSSSDLMVFQGALVDRARNQLIERMLDHPIDPTHLFFLDADVVPPPDTLTKLLAAGEPIVSGLYRKRLPPYEPMAFVKNSPIPIKGPRLRKVDVVGAGCLLIERKVFEKIDPPWFTSQWTDEGHLSEDFSFCEKARAAGFEVYVDTSIRPLHLEPMGVGTSSGGSVSFFPMD
jgi:GT2 family glycosyltransferase